LKKFPFAFYAAGRSRTAVTYNVDPTRPSTDACRPDRFPSLEQDDRR